MFEDINEKVIQGNPYKKMDIIISKIIKINGIKKNGDKNLFNDIKTKNIKHKIKESKIISIIDK